MGSLKSGLVAIALTSLAGMAAVVGCSADGGGAITDTDPTLPAEDPNLGKLPPSSSSGEPAATDAGKDASKKDSGPKPEAGVDAGPPPPVVGAACPTLDVTVTKPCGKCGTAATLCLNDGTGKGKWSEYGVCTGEMGTCTPGEVVTEDCGNCGKQVKTCSQFCAFTTSACTGQPLNSCKAGTTEYSGAGCVTPETYRNRACGDACTWGNFSATCEAEDLTLNIGAAAGATTSKTIMFRSTKVASRLSAFSTCPLSTTPTAGNYPYQYVEIHNPSATKAATVTIYASPAAGGVVIDTIMAAYSTSIRPTDDASRKACAFGVNDQSSAADVALTTDTDFSILKAVTIPAGASVIVYVASYYVDGSAGNITTGSLNINALIETLN